MAVRYFVLPEHLCVKPALCLPLWSLPTAPWGKTQSLPRHLTGRAIFWTFAKVYLPRSQVFRRLDDSKVYYPNAVVKGQEHSPRNFRE